MIHKTKGIVLHKIKYSESSVIAKIYTEQFGLQSYIIQGAAKKKAPVKNTLLQPLSLLDMVAYRKETAGLQRIKEMRLDSQFSTIPFDVNKSSVVLFLADMLYKTIKEEESNPAMFQFIENTIKKLDEKQTNATNFHLLFLVKLSKYLGFYPQGTYSITTCFFDLEEGVFCPHQPFHNNFLSNDLAKTLSQLLGTNFDNIDTLKISREQRKTILVKLIDFYRYHLANFGEVKSHEVLEEVLG
ncbi:DNA repair protein RecO [Bacteroidales bacterium AH-315-I05]|nr:DNA repair protein RecO [Bacteroidales bacterium AH-315-I05]